MRAVAISAAVYAKTAAVLEHEGASLIGRDNSNTALRFLGCRPSSAGCAAMRQTGSKGALGIMTIGTRHETLVSTRWFYKGIEIARGTSG